MEVSLLELVGRLHPLLIHFPIAFLLLTGARSLAFKVGYPCGCFNDPSVGRLRGDLSLLARAQVELLPAGQGDLQGLLGLVGDRRHRRLRWAGLRV